MKLSGKQKRYLRAKANHMRSIFSVGKNGLDQTWLTEVERAVNNRELVKVSLQQSSDASVDDVADFVTKNSDIEVVQKIGRTLLLFKPADEEKKQKISTEVFHL